ncbi:hypothetical protein ACO22_05039 [Paracoccidioides brasiliensis]|uniref:Uncharacterized protein n=1 Tax=Paracoccidioides brasiliensis TaxID=121759 RepID=A0A1D2JBH2_PARBR|nr:hypothetical protein ACO22_05039 [Paracoccidioides brasiliensis]
MAPCYTLIASNTTGCLLDRRSVQLSGDRNPIFFSESHRPLIPILTTIHSLAKSLQAETESIEFAFTTTITVTATATIAGSANTRFSSYLSSSSKPLILTPSSSRPSHSLPSRFALSTSTPTVSTTVAVPSRAEATQSTVVPGECSRSNGVPLPVLVLLIILAAVAAILSLVICWIRRSRKFCRHCKTVALNPSVGKQTPSANGVQIQASQIDNRPSVSRTNRGEAVSVSSLNSQLTRDTKSGTSQQLPAGDSIPSSFYPHNLSARVATIEPRILQLNWESSRANPDTLNPSTSVNGSEERRDPASSIASIIDEYAQIPDENEYSGSHQANKDVRNYMNSNLRHNGSSSAHLRMADFQPEKRDNSPVIGTRSILPDPACKYFQSNGKQDYSVAGPIAPYDRRKKKQDTQPSPSETGQFGSTPRSESSFGAPKEDSRVQTPRYEKQDNHSDVNSTPVESLRATRPSSLPSMISPQMSRSTKANNGSPLPADRAELIRSSCAPSNTTQDSDANISRMLRQWAFIDQQNFGLKDHCPGRSSPTWDVYDSHSKAKLKSHVLGVRTSISTRLPGILSKLSFSGNRGARKSKDAQFQAADYPDHESPSNHYSVTFSVENGNPGKNRIGEALRYNSHNPGFRGPYLLQRTYSESVYSRPTLERVPEVHKFMEIQKQGPSKHLPATSFPNGGGGGSDNDKPASYEFNTDRERKATEHIAKRQHSVLSPGKRNDSGNHQSPRRDPVIRRFADTHGGIKEKEPLNDVSTVAHVLEGNMCFNLGPCSIVSMRIQIAVSHHFFNTCTQFQRLLRTPDPEVLMAIKSISDSCPVDRVALDSEGSTGSSGNVIGENKV